MFGKLKEMANGFSQMREAQQKAKEIENSLKNKTFELKSVNVTVKANAKKQLLSLEIAETADIKKLSKEILDLMNKVEAKAEELAIQEMRSLLG
jgi:DNA-binding protein YbaB